MEIIIGSSFWILGLAVIFNFIESTVQSETPGEPRLQTADSGRKTKSGTPKHILRELGIPNFPVRKVRCPDPTRRREYSTFMLSESESIYKECTSDKILLAMGPIIFGHISGDRIRPISREPGSDVLYDERHRKKIPVDITYLRKNFNVLGRVPEHIVNSPECDLFGLYDYHGYTPKSRSPKRCTKNLIRKIFGPSSSSSSNGPAE